MGRMVVMGSCFAGKNKDKIHFLEVMAYPGGARTFKFPIKRKLDIRCLNAVAAEEKQAAC